MKQLRVPHPHAEISGLLGVQNTPILEKLGFELAFWIVSDEQKAEASLAVIGRRAGGDWEVVPFRGALTADSTAKRTDDAETLARAGGWIYVFGSHYGSKKGPLKPSRSFVARLNESLVALEDGVLTGQMHVVRRPFVLHRIINDALKASNVDVLPLTDGLRTAFIDATVQRGRDKDKGWRDRIVEGDVPINIEGATFLDGGHVVLGLRYPVTAGGHPLLVEVEGLDRFFTPDLPPPSVVAITEVTNVGSPEVPAGIRELDCTDGALHLITGDLDSKPEKSRVLKEQPEAQRAVNEHWIVPLVRGEPRGRRVQARRVREFGPDATVEGIAIDAGHVWYAHDKEEIVIEQAPLD